jgi:tetratricopeptide (TPR) repeat protein
MLLDGRARWGQDLSDPWALARSSLAPQILWKTPSLGAGTVLVNDRFRLVAEARTLKLWPNLPGRAAERAEAAETARGTELVRKGRLQEAVAAFGKAVQLAPTGAEPRLLLADSLDQLGRREDAAAALDAACKLDARHAWLLADLGRSRLNEGRHDEALALFGKAVQYRPRDAAVHFQRGEAFAAAGSPDKAVDCWEKAVELYPDHGEAWARLADALAGLGRPGEARRARQRVAEITPALGQPERVKKAQAFVEQLRKNFPASRFLNTEFEVGRRLLWSNYVEESIPYLQKAVLNQPDTGDVLGELGCALTRRGQHAEALVLLRRGQARGADWVTRWIREAERGPERDAARKKALEAAEAFGRQPADAAAGRALADAYDHLFEYPKNAREYLAPDAELPSDPEQWFDLANILLLAGDTDLHRRLCERALEQSKKLAQPGVNNRSVRNAYVISRLCVLAEKPPVEMARVLELAEQAVKGDPSAWHQHGLGLAYYRMGKYEEAVRHLTRSVTEHPEWEAQVVNSQALALAYHRLGQDDEARRWRDKAAEWIDRTATAVARETSHAWPLHPHDLLAMWLLEREIAEAFVASKP